MAKLGFSYEFDELMESYEGGMESFESELIKILYRCVMTYEQTHRVKKLFQMLQKKNKILRHFYELLSNPDKVEKSEVLLAAFCLHSSRCFVQINKFLQEYKSIKQMD